MNMGRCGGPGGKKETKKPLRNSLCWELLLKKLRSIYFQLTLDRICYIKQSVQGLSQRLPPLWCRRIRRKHRFTIGIQSIMPGSILQALNLFHWTDEDFERETSIRKECQLNNIYPDYTINSFQEIPPIIQELNQQQKDF